MTARGAMQSLLAIERLTKRFGSIVAVDDVDFAVERGEVLGFLGPNGAGKSTTMRMITGYLPPSAGRVRVAGFDVGHHPLEIKRRIGYLPEGAPTYGEMTPRRILDFTARMRRLDAGTRRRRTGQMVERLHLQPVLDRPIETLSKGFKRRVGLALALLHDPEVLILDEPTDGLDPNQKHEVRTLLADIAPAKATIISTHILEEVDALCTRAIVIADGRLVADSRPRDLLARSRHHNAVTVRLGADQVDLLQAWVARCAGVVATEVVPGDGDTAELIAFPEAGRDILGRVQAAIEEAEVEIEEIRVERGRLDDVFRELTRAA
ncbi:MAG TPA: ABC transporter ATP-binding protein [Geminicoccaceae bacterium]